MIQQRLKQNRNPYERFYGRFALFWTAFLVMAGWAVKSMTDETGALIAVIFFVIILAILLSNRWVVNKTYFGHSNLFFKTMFPIGRIKRIYLSKLPNDPRVLDRALLMNEIVSAGSLAARLGSSPVLNKEEIKYMAEKYSPVQIWIEVINPNGQAISWPLAEKSKQARSMGLGALKKCLYKLERQLPAATIDPGVFQYL
ncbi:MAG: hypothetical protein C3F02_01830 [Parcubacteria group bacterium]|nr:MAG: hypothetical protein C3F02_01830 [Parcubacteria group bacterium]